MKQRNHDGDTQDGGSSGKKAREIGFTPEQTQSVISQ